ncbi:MAG TPA: hypothetical protein VFE17_13120 [Candidatus Baltobacteraceae bacterium]|jgi:hypothetical protein|nr:hypothetical protein [Candidatus Baltobacteraceae bacterium]
MLLRRLTVGLFVLACAAAAAACSSSTTTPSSGGFPGIGPNFVTNTIYVANTTQEVIDIFTPSPGPSATPQYAIGGSNTTMTGPQYLSFNSNKQLYVTNYNPATSSSSILVFQTYATGNVLPFGSVPLNGAVHPRGIATLPDNSGYVVATTNAGGFYPNTILIYGALGLSNTIGGSNTGLNVPVGVAVDGSKNIYVSNNGAASVSIFAFPSPSPTPSSTPSPSPSPSPSASPTASPTPSAQNIAPATTIAGTNTQLRAPTGIALDSSGNIYVADAGSVASGVAPKVLVFNAPFAGGALNIAPSHVIISQNPSFIDPTDVKLDSSGNVYVIDAGTGPNSSSKMLIFAAGSFGTVTPNTAITLPQGSAIGEALSP